MANIDNMHIFLPFPGTGITTFTKVSIINLPCFHFQALLLKYEYHSFAERTVTWQRKRNAAEDSLDLQ